MNLDNIKNEIQAEVRSENRAMRMAINCIQEELMKIQLQYKVNVSKH